MENINNNIDTNADTKGSKKKSKASRKWREIEALKDQFELQKELCDIDILEGYDISSLKDGH